QKNHGFSPKIVGLIAIIYNIGALLGGIIFGAWSERIGRRKAIVIASLLAIPCIPLWAYGKGFLTLAIGGFLMQFMVQGAWGVVPAHLNELSPPRVRGTFPGSRISSATCFRHGMRSFRRSLRSRVSVECLPQCWPGPYWSSPRWLRLSPG